MIDSGLLDDKKVELIRGEIVEMPPEKPPHYNQNDEGYEYLLKLMGDRAKVRKSGSITLPNGSEPQPDIAVCQRLGREYRQHHPYPANIFWLIEYSDSTLKKDLEVKSQIYAEVGIQEYWIVNVQRNELIVMRSPENGKYTIEFRTSSGTIQPLAFPDLEIEVEKIISP